MLRKYTCHGLFYSIFLFMLVFSLEAEFPELKGPYLGQIPPGPTPEIFAPGIVSTTAVEAGCGFTRDGRFFVFRRSGEGILLSENKNGTWTDPRPIPFTIPGQDGDFMLSPRGDKIFFASGRPISPGKQTLRNHNIWIVNRKESGWSEANVLGPAINTEKHESFPCVTENGKLYFFRRQHDPDSDADIYSSTLENGRYNNITKLGPPINSQYNDLDAFVSPDESYMIFCSDRPGGYGRSDFYISFLRSGDVWGKPVNLGAKINSPGAEWIPYVTTDGKYFFFTSDKSGNWDLYWVDAGIIDELKPAEIDQ